MKLSLPFVGFLQASGLTAYVSLVVWLMQTIGTRGAPSNPVIQGITVLLLFVMSAMICASIMLGYPAWLFRAGKTTQALTIVGWGIGWLFAYFVLFLVCAMVV